MLNTTIKTTRIPKPIHAHDKIPIQFSLREDSLFVTTESNGSVSETSPTLGSDISLDGCKLELSLIPPSESNCDVTADALSYDGDTEFATACCIVLEDEWEDKEELDGMEALLDEIEELDGGGEELGTEEDESKAEDVFWASKSGK